jgi:hypothetical protein
MIGYLIEQELGNLLPENQPLATLLTMTEVDPDDPAFADPTKFVGSVYDEATARAAAAEHGWTVKPDGPHWRRVVASPKPLRIFEIRPVDLLLRAGCVVICAGGGGIPTMFERDAQGRRSNVLAGVEAVVDKDLASGVLARELGATPSSWPRTSPPSSTTGVCRPPARSPPRARSGYSPKGFRPARWDRRSRRRRPSPPKPADRHTSGRSR